METQEGMNSDILSTLLKRNMHHILENIFFSLDFKSYKTCLDVSNGWKELLTSKSFLKKGNTVFYTDILKDGMNLWMAAKEGDKDKVAKILAPGFVDVNFSTGGRSALMEAACEGHKNVVHLLAVGGADLNGPHRFGKNYLYHAAENGKFNVVRFLIKSGAESPIVLAAREGEISIVQLLLQAGDNPNKKDWAGETPLGVASHHNHKEVVQLL